MSKNKNNSQNNNDNNSAKSPSWIEKAKGMPMVYRINGYPAIKGKAQALETLNADTSGLDLPRVSDTAARVIMGSLGGDAVVDIVAGDADQAAFMKRLIAGDVIEVVPDPFTSNDLSRLFSGGEYPAYVLARGFSLRLVAGAKEIAKGGDNIPLSAPMFFANLLVKPNGLLEDAEKRTLRVEDNNIAQRLADEFAGKYVKVSALWNAHEPAVGGMYTLRRVRLNDEGRERGRANQRRKVASARAKAA